MVNFDDSSTWLTAELHTPPSAVNISGYQKQIDKICGFTPNGKSTVILSWMPSIENYSREYYEWNVGGFGTKSFFRCAYKYFEDVTDENGNPLDIPPPRWALKQWQSGAQYNATDDLTRWQKSVSGSQSAVKEIRPAHPKEGRYIPMLRIGKRRNNCCQKAKSERKTCFCEYREPDGAHLELLRQAVKIRESEGGQNPNEPISAKTLLSAAIEAAQIEEQKRIESKKLIRGVIDEHYNEIIGIEPTTAYSLPKFKKNKENGLLLPVN